MKITLVHDKEGASAAFYIKKYISDATDLISDEYEPIEVIQWTEKHWLDNRVTSQGEVSNFTLFIGKIEGTKDIMDVADIKFNEYGIIYSISKPYAVLTANPDILKNSPKDYSSFVKKLQEIAPNRIDNTTHGKKRFLSFIKGGILKLRHENQSLRRQQLLYGAAVFCRKQLRSFLGDQKK